MILGFEQQGNHDCMLKNKRCQARLKLYQYITWNIYQHNTYSIQNENLPSIFEKLNIRLVLTKVNSQKWLTADAKCSVLDICGCLGYTSQSFSIIRFYNFFSISDIIRQNFVWQDCVSSGFFFPASEVKIEGHVRKKKIKLKVKLN